MECLLPIVWQIGVNKAFIQIKTALYRFSISNVVWEYWMKFYPKQQCLFFKKARCDHRNRVEYEIFKPPFRDRPIGYTTVCVVSAGITQLRHCGSSEEESKPGGNASAAFKWESQLNLQHRNTFWIFKLQSKLQWFIWTASPKMKWTPAVPYCYTTVYSCLACVSADIGPFLQRPRWNWIALLLTQTCSPPLLLLHGDLRKIVRHYK